MCVCKYVLFHVCVCACLYNFMDGIRLLFPEQNITTPTGPPPLGMKLSYRIHCAINEVIVYATLQVLRTYRSLILKQLQPMSQPLMTVYHQ